MTFVEEISLCSCCLSKPGPSNSQGMCLHNVTALVHGHRSLLFRHWSSKSICGEDLLPSYLKKIKTSKFKCRANLMGKLKTTVIFIKENLHAEFFLSLRQGLGKWNYLLPVITFGNSYFWSFHLWTAMLWLLNCCLKNRKLIMCFLF